MVDINILCYENDCRTNKYIKIIFHIRNNVNDPQNNLNFIDQLKNKHFSVL